MEVRIMEDYFSDRSIRNIIKQHAGRMKQGERIILIPTKRMKRFLKQQTKGIISQRAVVLIQDYCQQTIEELCEKSIIEHQEQNRLRRIHGLPELKKIGLSEFLSLLHSFNKPKFDCLLEGEVGNHNGNTTLSKADKKVN
jgi:histone H3/H4